MDLKDSAQRPVRPPCYLCMRCMSTPSQVLNWRHRKHLSPHAAQNLSTLNHLELLTSLKYQDVSNSLSYFLPSTKCYRFFSFLKDDTYQEHTGLRSFVGILASFVSPDVYKLITYSVCSTLRTKSQIHIFLNLQFKSNSKPISTEICLKI